MCTEATTFTDFNDKKVHIERGTAVKIPVHAIHMDPQYYPNPDKFDPERFSEANGGLRAYKDRGIFLAFGDGPRICVGKCESIEKRGELRLV